MSLVEVRRLAEDAEPEVLAALDRIAEAARLDLVGRRGALEPFAARLADPSQPILWAGAAGAPVGFVQGVLHHPIPGALTVAQLAVERAHRYRGLGRRLVEGVAALAQASLGPLDDVYAAVRDDAVGAQAFWSSLGFVPAPDHPDLLHPAARPGWLAVPPPR